MRFLSKTSSIVSWPDAIRLLFFRSSLLLLLMSVQACSPSGSGIPASRPADFESPTRLVLSEAGNIYVSDYKKGTVEILNGNGRKIDHVGPFTAPLGVAVFEAPPLYDCPGLIKKSEIGECDGKTILFVGDKGNGTVKVFIDGVKRGVLGKGRREFIMPNSIAVSSDMEVYVVDSMANQVLVYDSSGDLKQVFGEIDFDFPTDIAINENAGELYVADFNNRLIRVYDLEGNWIRDIFAPDNDQGGPAFWKPAGIGIDSLGDLYVVDNALSCMVKIGVHGGFLDIIGYSSGQLSPYWTGEISVPVDVAVGNGRIYITSNGERQVRIFEVTP